MTNINDKILEDGVTIIESIKKSLNNLNIKYIPENYEIAMSVISDHNDNKNIILGKFEIDLILDKDIDDKLSKMNIITEEPTLMCDALIDLSNKKVYNPICSIRNMYGFPLDKKNKELQNKMKEIKKKFPEMIKKVYL